MKQGVFFLTLRTHDGSAIWEKVDEVTDSSLCVLNEKKKVLYYIHSSVTCYLPENLSPSVGARSLKAILI